MLTQERLDRKPLVCAEQKVLQGQSWEHCWRWRDSYFSDVVQGGQLQQLGQNVQGWTQEASKLLIGAVEVQSYLETWRLEMELNRNIQSGDINTLLLRPERKDNKKLLQHPQPPNQTPTLQISTHWTNTICTQPFRMSTFNTHNTHTLTHKQTQNTLVHRTHTPNILTQTLAHRTHTQTHSRCTTNKIHKTVDLFSLKGSWRRTEDQPCQSQSLNSPDEHRRTL